MKREHVAPTFRRIWIITIDHSVVGVRPTKAEATESAILLKKQSIDGVTYHVVGPYVYRGGK